MNFEFTDSAYNARKIKAVFDELEPLLNQPHTRLQSKSDKNITVAAKAVGVNSRIKSLKAVPVPTNGAKAKAKIRKGKLVIDTGFLEREFIGFDRKKLARGKAGYVADLLRAYKPRDKFVVNCGNYFIDNPMPRDMAPDYIAGLMSRYQAGNEVRGKKVAFNRRWQTWLIGVSRLATKNQKSLTEWRKQGRAAKKKHKRIKLRKGKRN